MHFCLKLGITYIKLGICARDMQIRIAKLGIARAMWNFGVEILARAKFWLSPSIEFWLLIFRRLPVLFFKHPAQPLVVEGLADKQTPARERNIAGG